MINKILVPLDGSSLAEYALRPAVALACPNSDASGDGRLILLRVPVPEDIYLPSAAVRDDTFWAETYDDVERTNVAIGEAESYLGQIRDSLVRPGLAVSIKVAAGDVATIIVDTAAHEEADLIVMGTHGRSGLSRWIMGSVTERVVQTAECPILAVCTDQVIRHILITLDGSRLAETVLEPALSLAQKLNSDVTIFFVEQSPVYSTKLVSELEQAEAGLGEQYLASIFAWPRDYLAQISDRLQRYGVPFKNVMASGPVAQSIMNYVQDGEVDLIAMCTHGRTGLQRRIFGSITEKVFRGCARNMLIVRSAYAQERA